MSFKNYLLVEDARNVAGHKFFERFLRRAVGPNVQVLVAHHITYIDPETNMPTEIPSADTLLFDPDMMGKVFGAERSRQIMLTLAMRTPDLRDRVLNDFLDMLDLEEANAAREAAGLVGTGNVEPVATTG